MGVGILNTGSIDYGASGYGMTSEPMRRSASKSASSKKVLSKKKAIKKAASNQRENSNPLEAYKAELGVDAALEFPGEPGELRVWIGAESAAAQFSTDMVTDQAVLGVTGETAKVTPYAPAFDVLPVESQCIKVHPSGSEVRFSLSPKKSGEFKVGADVSLYSSADCSGAPIPKSVASLAVNVEVNTGAYVMMRAAELWAVFWEKTLEFWGAFLVMFFGLILFLIRGRFAAWFGFPSSQS